MTLLVNGFDLSIGHNMALCAVLCIGFEKNFGGGAGIVIALATGAAMGLVNGLLVKLTRGESSEGFMITLATGMMAQALAKWYCGGSEIIRPQIPESQDWFRVLGQGNTIGGFPVCALIWIAIMAILQIIVKKTTFGRKMLLTGANKKSAYLAGINVGAIKVIAYTVAGLCCGIAAIIYSARFNSANDGSGVGGDFNGAVISIIGGNALYGGHGGMVQVFIGAVTFGLITNILQLLGISSAVQFIVQGAVLLLAINLDRLKKR
jgi:ribose/xylose/arabinose/galactoside ABC-type transport system permease subunit